MKAPAAPRELAPEGTEPFTVTGFLDLGTQTTEFDGEEKQQRQCVVEYEFTGLKRSDGKPFVISERNTYSASPRSNLGKRLAKGFGIKDPENFDLANIVGLTGLGTITHKPDKKGNTWANLENVSPLPKGMKADKAKNPKRYFSLDPSEYDQTEFDALSDSYKKKIMDSPEYTAVTTPAKGKAAPAKAVDKKGKK